MEIEKGKPSRILAGEEMEEWQTLKAGEAFKITEALADPLRQWVYQELEKGPLRQSELAKRASEALKKRVTNVLMRYHLQRLEKAGLVRFERDASSKRSKVAVLAAEMRVQLRPSMAIGERPTEELDEELSKIFRTRTKRW